MIFLNAFLFELQHRAIIRNIFYSSLLATIVSNLPSCHDLDFSGLNIASLVLVATLIFLIMILIFVVLVVAASNPLGCGFGYNY